MRILIDQSGYDLMNLGDVAMLKSCVARLQMQWPDAEIMIITHRPERLEWCCSGAIPVRTAADQALLRILPRKTRLISEQAWKIIGPYFYRHADRTPCVPAQPRSAIQAVRAADLVVASGGAYMTDTWWWHAAGVLSLLSLAHRLGKPTAMFGQGIGPMALWPLRVQARTVLPGLTVLGLREERISRALALSMGIHPEALAMTGDDALELVDSATAPAGDAIGISVRVSSYAGVDFAAAAAIGDVVLETASELGVPIMGLPVSQHAADAGVLRALLRQKKDTVNVIVDDLGSPEALVSAAAKCRLIITGSYHAAVFGLAQGVPTVCLIKSSYYDAKFGGLQASFPGACIVVPLDAPDALAGLRAAIKRGLQLPSSARAAARDTATQLREAGREAYTLFRSKIDEEQAKITTGLSKGR